MALPTQTFVLDILLPYGAGIVQREVDATSIAEALYRAADDLPIPPPVAAAAVAPPRPSVNPLTVRVKSVPKGH